MGGFFSSEEYKAPEIKSTVFPEFEKKAPDLEGMSFAVTGCTSGTGLVAAKLLAKKGGNVLMLNRPSKRAGDAFAAVSEAAADGATVTHVDCDLQDFASVRAAAKKVLALTGATGLDVLCNNAGVMALEDKATKDGYDVQMQTNHLSHFLLTKELYPALVKAADLRGDARIVNHSSTSRKIPTDPMTAENAARYLGKNGGNLGGDSASMLKGGARWVRYHMTKLANVVFTLALADKLPPKIKALCCAPGLAATGLQETTAKTGGMGSGTWFMRFAQSAEDGACPLLTCCLSKDAKTGEFYEPGGSGIFGKGTTGVPALTPLEPICLEGDRDALWSASEAACGEWKL
jgi:NAD(P)-dependent dehydrogenase (short-subunit alcohol dehydrogenase family)